MLMSLLHMVCACTYQFLQFYTTTIDMVLTDCVECCHFTWQKFKPPAIFVTAKILEKLWQWEELLFIMLITRLLCEPFELQLLNFAQCCKEAILTATWCVTVICDRRTIIFVIREILQILELDEVTRLLYEWITTLIWHILLFLLLCLLQGPQAIKLRRKGLIIERNPHFGGRGYGGLIKPKRKRAAKATKLFNSTLGFPDEG